MTWLISTCHFCNYFVIKIHRKIYNSSKSRCIYVLYITLLAIEATYT